MKTRRLKIFLYAIFFTSATFTVTSLDFGLTIDNSTSANITQSGNENPSNTFSQQDKVAAWFQTEMGTHFDFSIQGSYTYSIDIPVLLDMDSIVIKGSFPYIQNEQQPSGKTIPSLFEFQLGRFYISDPTGYVLNHRVDGFGFSFNYPSTIVNVYFGYTGFLLKPTSSILLSKEDINDLSEDSVFLASPRFIGLFNITLLNLYKQNIAVTTLFQQDLRATINTSDFLRDLYNSDIILLEGETTQSAIHGGLINTQYMGLIFQGPIINTLYYRLAGYLGTGKTLSYIDNVYTYTPILSGLGSLRLRYFLPITNSYAEAEYIYATGDSTDTSLIEGNTDATATAFVPISNSTASGVVFSPGLKNVSNLKLKFSIKPLANDKNPLLNSLQIETVGFAFFRNTTGPISEKGVSPTSTGLFLGTEGDIIVNWRPLSDVGLSLTNGLFIPNSEVFGTNRNIEYRGNLNISLSF